MSHFRKKKVEFFVFLVIVFAALLFRFYDLSSTPPGLWVDEAMNGTDALTALETKQAKIFYPANNGREGLFINLQALSIKAFGNTAFALRFVSAVVGTLTVIGVYFLVRHLFAWNYAAVAAALTAISFWSVNFSRIGFRAVMVPLILTWSFYFLWRGLKKSQLGDFIAAGIIAGLGFYTYLAYRVSPLIFLVLVLNYWLHLKSHFQLSEYKFLRNRLLKNMGIMVLTTFIVALPFFINYIDQRSDFTNRQGQLSVFSQESPLRELGKSVVLTLGMFNFYGDQNLRHNISGSPILAWPVGIFFFIGFVRELIHWFKRKPGHFSTTHTFLFAWFFVMLLPGFLSTEAPHALRAVGAIPVVMIFAARGLLWTFEKISNWYAMNEPTYQINKAAFRHEAKVITVFTVVIFLSAVAVFEWNRYFNVWAKHPHISYAFTSHLSDIAEYLNENPTNQITFIIPSEPGVIVDGVSIFAQPIKYLTETQSESLAVAKNYIYLNLEDLKEVKFPPHYRMIITEQTSETMSYIKELGLSVETFPTFAVYHK